MADGNVLRLVISEQNPILSRALGTFFSGQPNIEVVGQAADSAESLHLCERMRPDVILVDSDLRPMHILKFIDHLCNEKPDIQIVVLVSNLDETPLWRYEEAGASAAVEQGIFASDLLRVLQTVYRNR